LTELVKQPANIVHFLKYYSPTKPNIMKPKSSFLAMFFSLSVLLLLFSACPPDPDIATPKPGQLFDQSSGDSIKPVRGLDHFSEFEGPLGYEDDEYTELEPSLNLSEAMKSVDFSVHPDWQVAIKGFTCIRSGKSLVVYNPSRPDLNFYNSSRFAVYWFKDGRPIKGTHRIECVCKGEFAAIVIYKPSNRGVGFAFYEGRACAADQLETVLNTDL